MGPFTAISAAFAKTLTFNGRSSRSEFWWYFLALALVQGAAFAADIATVLPYIFAEDIAAMMQFSVFDFFSFWVVLLTGLTSISLQVRRLHDAGYSGFWLFINIVPLGALVLLVFFVMPSKQETSHWGPPAAGGRDVKGRPVTQDAHTRAMQGYACLFERDREPSPEALAARKAEISAYYRSKVLKPQGDPA
ncbi:MAG: DUF805 domain-containing protein [Sulfitobacter sp.]